MSQKLVVKLSGQQASFYPLSISIGFFPVCRCHFQKPKRVTRRITVVSRGTSACMWHKRTEALVKWTQPWVRAPNFREGPPGFLWWLGWTSSVLDSFFRLPEAPAWVGRPLASCSSDRWGHTQCHFCLPDRMLPQHPQQTPAHIHLRSGSRAHFSWVWNKVRGSHWALACLEQWKEKGWTWSRRLVKSATQSFVLTKRTTERQDKGKGENKKSGDSGHGKQALNEDSSKPNGKVHFWNV